MTATLFVTLPHPTAGAEPGRDIGPHHDSHATEQAAVEEIERSRVRLEMQYGDYEPHGPRRHYPMAIWCAEPREDGLGVRLVELVRVVTHDDRVQLVRSERAMEVTS